MCEDNKSGSKIEGVDKGQCLYEEWKQQSGSSTLPVHLSLQMYSTKH